MDRDAPALTQDDRFLREVEKEVNEFRANEEDFAKAARDLDAAFLFPTERFFGHLEDTQIFACTMGHGALDNVPISGGTDTTVRVWEPTVSRHPGSWDQTIAMWHGTSGKLLKVLEGHFAEVTSILFRDDQLMSASLDQQVILWDCRAAKQVASHRSASAGGLYALAGSGEPQSHLVLVSGCDGSVGLVDMSKPGDQLVRSFVGHGTGVAAVARLGSFVVSADRTGRLLVHDFGSGALIQEIAQVHTNRVTGMETCPETGHLYTASVDGSVREWSTHTGLLTLSQTLHSVDLMMHCLAVGVDEEQNRVVYLGGDDCTLRRWTPNEKVTMRIRSDEEVKEALAERAGESDQAQQLLEACGVVEPSAAEGEEISYEQMKADLIRMGVVEEASPAEAEDEGEDEVSYEEMKAELQRVHAGKQAIRAAKAAADAEWAARAEE